MPAERSAFLPVSADEAFALLTEPERLSRWMAVSARVDLRAGGSYAWEVVPGHVAAGTYIEVIRGKRIVFGWGWQDSPTLGPDASTVTVTFEPADGGTWVRLTHDGLPADEIASHDEGWVHYLDRLVRLVTTGDAGPDEWGLAVTDPSVSTGESNTTDKAD